MVFGKLFSVSKIKYLSQTKIAKLFWNVPNNKGINYFVCHCTFNPKINPMHNIHL